MNILMAGRILDILSAIQDQDWNRAANLARNSPGIDWQRHTTKAAIARINAVPLPATMMRQPSPARQGEQPRSTG